MPLEERIEHLEEGIGRVEPVVQLIDQLLGGLVRSAPLPFNLEKIRSRLRSAHDLSQRGQPRMAESLFRQAEENLRAVQQWLAVADLAISPFALRTFLERNPPSSDLLRVVIRYLLTKQARLDSDRDKVDYLLTTYVAASDGGEDESLVTHPGALQQGVTELFAGLSYSEELSDVAEMSMHELESLTALVAEFNDFDNLVRAHVVERVRALKTNLGEAFYHPKLLATVIRFNLTFRRRFDELFHEEVGHICRLTRRRIEQAWEIIRDIEAAQEAAAVPAGEAVAAAPLPEQDPGADVARLGRPLDVRDERLPLDRLSGRGQAKQKEQELRGLVNRLGRFLANLSPQQVAAGKVIFPLRRGELAVEPWEREAFAPASTAAAPESTRVIQHVLGVVAGVEEALAHLKEGSEERYLWKAHLDELCYSVARAVELLTLMRGLHRSGVSAAEAAWSGSLLHTALRLGITLNRVMPAFERAAAR